MRSPNKDLCIESPPTIREINVSYLELEDVEPRSGVSIFQMDHFSQIMVKLWSIYPFILKILLS